MTAADRRRRRRITRAVRRGQVLPTAAEARVAVERAIEEQRSLRRSRIAYVGVALLAGAGVVAGIVGPFAFLFPSGFLLGFVVIAQFFYLPRMERNVAQAEELNRAAAAGGPEEPAVRPDRAWS